MKDKILLLMTIMLLAGCTKDKLNNRIIELENQVNDLTNNTVITHYSSNRPLYEEKYTKDDKVVKYYNYDENNILTGTETYNSDGLIEEEFYVLNKKIWYDKNGSITHEMNFKYDPLTDSQVKIITYYKNGEIIRCEEYHNDELKILSKYNSGKLLSRDLYNIGMKQSTEWLDDAGDLIKVELYIYDLNGILIKKEIKDNNSTTIGIEYYNENGDLVSSEVYENDKLTFHIQYTTDKSGNKIVTSKEYGDYLKHEEIEYYDKNIIKKVVKNFDLGTLSDMDITYYDKDGIKESVEYYNNLDKPILIYRFDLNGNIVIVENLIDGLLTSKEINEYDKLGNLSFTYVYDSKGVLTEKREYILNSDNEKIMNKYDKDGKLLESVFIG